MKKLILIILFIISKTLIFTQGKGNWEFSNGFTKNGNLFIIYKSLPPIGISVTQLHSMKITKNDRKFKYSENTGALVKVDAIVDFNKEIAAEAEDGINKQIVKNIYNRVKYSIENPKFKLNYIPSIDKKDNKISADVESYINGEAYFTNRNGVRLETTEPIVEFGDSIQGGKLETKSSIYIDADFEVPDGVELLNGNYKGSIVLKAEFLGNNVLR